MPIVKTILVRMTAQGAADTRDALAEVAAAADAIPDSKTVRVRFDVDKSGLARLGLAGLGDGGGAGGGGAGGFLSGLLGKVAGLQIPLGPAGSVSVGTVGILAAISPAFGSIISGTMGIIPLFAAASMGVASFGALAVPTFTKVAAAITAIGAATNKTRLDRAWDAVPKAMVPVVKGIIGIQSEFGKLSQKLQPLVLRIAGVGLQIANKLLPALLPFAQVAGKAILGLAQGFDRFASSPGFKTFMAAMLRLSGPAIATIGEGLGKVAVAVGKFLEALINPRALGFLRDLFIALAALITGLGDVIRWLGIAGNAIGTFAKNALSVWRAAWDGMTGAISAAGNFIGRVLTVDIPHAGAALLNWFASLPGKVSSFLGSLPGILFSAGSAAIGGLLSGLESALPSVLSFVSGIAGKIASLKGPIEKDKVLLVPAGIAIMAGLQAGMMKGRKGVDDLAADIGVRISDKLMDAFMSRNDLRSDRAGKAIGLLLRARLLQIRSFILGIAAQEVAWASIASAVTGPNFTNPRWIRGHAAIPGTPGGIVFGHLGGPVVTPGTLGTPATRGHWAGGLRPVSAAQLLHNMRLDLGRLRQFGVVLGKLRRMGLDNTLIQQIIAAGPDQGFQIAEAILDAGKQEVLALDRTERGIRRAGISIGKTAARSQFGNGITQIINFNGFIAGNPRAIAREIQKLLRELRRANGGKALGFD